MTADWGYIQCEFIGTSEVMDTFRKITAQTDRLNQFSHGLSWLDDLDCEDCVESESVSFDTIAATRDFLTDLLARLPELQFTGKLEHSWPTLPCRKTVVEFEADGGTLLWQESSEEEAEEEFFPEFEDEDRDEDDWDIPYPTTP